MTITEQKQLIEDLKKDPIALDLKYRYEWQIKKFHESIKEFGSAEEARAFRSHKRNADMIYGQLAGYILCKCQEFYYIDDLVAEFLFGGEQK